MSKWEPIWLPLLFLASIVLEAVVVRLTMEQIAWAKKEYEYDEQKDLAKKQRRTRTTRKTTKEPSGGSVVEEQIEVTEPVQEARDGQQ